MLPKHVNGGEQQSRSKLWAIGLVLLMMIAHSFQWTKFTFMRSVYELVAIPIRIPLLFVKRKAMNLSSSMATQVELIKKVDELEKEVNSYRARLDDYSETKAQNKRLSDLIKFKKEYLPKSYMVAEVIGLDSHPLSETIIINKGSDSGVSLNDPVLTPEGVIGRVVDVYRYSSKVLLLTDSQSSIGAMIQRTRDIGDAMGNSSQTLMLTSISLDARVKPGDLVITSGMSTFYPKGLRIGTVSEVKKCATGREITVVPSSDTRKCEEVMVLLH